MKLNSLIYTLVLAGGSVVRAGECSKKQLESIAQYDAKAASACGTNIDGLFASSGSSVAVCKNQDCVEVLDSVADEYPDCTAAGLNLSNMLEAIAQYCKTEGNSTDGSHSGSTTASKPECSLSDKTKVTDLQNGPAMTEARGQAGVTRTYAKICSSECTTYMKEKYIPALPDCTLDGGDVEEATNIMLLYCAWIKFRAPFVPRHLALDIGRTVFAGLNAVELGLCLGLWLVYGISASADEDRLGLLIALTVVFIAQVVYIHPKLYLRGDFAIYEELKRAPEDLSSHQMMVFSEMQDTVTNNAQPPAFFHIIYVLGEVAKVVLLVLYSVHFLRQLSGTA
ncbi:hypothetical protein Poli38472_000105 [Pythium oligandrum]|uniref:Uncharacterized protein n=1 Tax=Pythium oligandrum TaxID=41045 RepID=A0A8K1CBQ3_PYTOL|nr:hypothetical protein Poli38472_000105 [Pythium oligandrum]|eukprot:TMW60063.1 hypothetical protein Poli38472_000105 [Pythium oligandrum]